MISSIFSAITALPALVTILEKVIAWIEKEMQKAKNRKLARDLEKATQAAQQTKDTSQMDHLFQGLGEDE